ncbi:MAG: hypothetical protein ACREBW_06210 [Candidatus Micrarchaeaceae archaeon]
MVSHDLFVRLGRYASTPERKPAENFFTELVAYILNHDKEARREFFEVFPKPGPGDLSSGEVHVETQQTIEAEAPNIRGKRPDIWICGSGCELLVESKIDSNLGLDQVENYLQFAQRRRGMWVMVVSKRRNDACERVRGRQAFCGELLWSQIADRWNGLRRQPGRDCVQQFLIEGALAFMEEYDMGAFEPLTEDEMKAPNLWRPFQAKIDKLLARLCDRLPERNWMRELELERVESYPGGCETQGYHRGTLWRSVNRIRRKDADFWYFLGLIYANLEYLPNLVVNEQPQIVVMVASWGADQQMRQFLSDTAGKLNGGLNSYHFEVQSSADGGGHPFLVRSAPLEKFISCNDQASSILEFFEESDRILAPHVPEIYRRFRDRA